MQLIAEKTTIPIPKIHAFALSDNTKPLSSFLILQYIEGRKLSHADLKTLSDEQRICLYTSLADIYIQLRRLEFPSIGCLTQGPDGFEVCKRTASIDLNMQELEGLAPHCIQCQYYGSQGILTSANNYITMLLEVADNAFAKDRFPGSQEESEDHLYHHHIFHEHVEGWVNHSLDHGPFALVHGDLELFNLILDDNMNIISVLDWEWSRVVPCQFFKPPLWLSSSTIDSLSYGFRYNEFLTLFDKFLAILRGLEQERFGNELLANEWNNNKQKSGFMVANALENWTAMDWFANRYINMRVYGGKVDLPERIKAFMQDDPARKALIEKRISQAYCLPNHDVVTAAIDGKMISASIRYYLTRLWKTPLPSYDQALPLTMGSVLVIAGVSYLLRKRSVQVLFSH